MKEKTATVDTPVSEPTGSGRASTAHASVYTFVIWDHDQQATVIYPRMATLTTIAKMRGKVNEESAWVVDATALDIEGFNAGDTAGRG